MKLLAWISCVVFSFGSLHEATAISCQPLDSTLFGECVRLGYNVSTSMENSTQNAILDLIRNIHGTFKQCSSLSNFMACSVHVPRCTPRLNDKNSSLPCMDVCKQFVAECKTSLRDFGLLRLFTGLCLLLPSDGSCLKPQNFSNSELKTESSNSTTCKPLTVRQCLDAGYNLTSISTDQQESFEKGSVFQGLNKSLCPALRKLVCMEMMPPCDNANRQSLHVPCKSLCEKAFQECPSQFGDIFKNSSYCSTFPNSKTKNDTGLCILDTWPSSGLWPSNLWTSFAGAAGSNTPASTPKSSINSTSTLQPPTTKSENNTASATSAPIPINTSVSPNTTTKQSGSKTTLATPKPITSSKSNRTSTASPPQNATTTARPPSSSSPNRTTTAKPHENGTTTARLPSSSGPNMTTSARPQGNGTTTARPPSSSGPNMTTSAKPRENGTTTARPSSSSRPNMTTTTKPQGNGTTTVRPPSSSSPKMTTSAKPTGNGTTTVRPPSSSSPNITISTKPKGNGTTTVRPPSRSSPNITISTKPKGNGTTTVRPPSSSSPNITISTKPKGNGTTTVRPPSSSSPNITISTKPKGNGTTAGPMTSPKGNSTAKPSQNGSTTALSTSAKSSPPSSGQTNSSPTQLSTAGGKDTGTAVLAHQGGSISAGGISGIVLGVIALFMAIAVGIVCFRRYHRNKSQFRHSIMVNMDEL